MYSTGGDLLEDSDADGEDPEEVNFRLLSEIGKGSLELNSGLVSVVEEGFSPSETEFTPSEFDNILLEVEGVSEEGNAGDALGCSCCFQSTGTLNESKIGVEADEDPVE